MTPDILEPIDETLPPEAETVAEDTHTEAAAPLADDTAEPALAPEVAPPTEAVAPVAKVGAYFVCVAPFNAFGVIYMPGDTVEAAEWPEGTLQRRLANGFVALKAA